MSDSDYPVQIYIPKKYYTDYGYKQVGINYCSYTDDEGHTKYFIILKNDRSGYVLAPIEWEDIQGGSNATN